MILKIYVEGTYIQQEKNNDNLKSSVKKSTTVQEKHPSNIKQCRMMDFEQRVGVLEYGLYFSVPVVQDLGAKEKEIQSYRALPLATLRITFT